MNIFLNLFLTFFKIGAFTFGGGYAMLPLMQEEVLAHKWMPLEDVVNFIAVSESTPGMTPHISGIGFGHEPATERFIWDICRDNLRRYAAGEPLAHVVDVAAGY